MSKKVLVSIVVLVLALVIVTGVVSAGKATVYNKQDNMRCVFSINRGVYRGLAKIVLVEGTEDGKINMHCATTLIRGNSVKAHKMRNVPFQTKYGYIQCDIQFAQSGNANVSCPNQKASSTINW